MKILGIESSCDETAAAVVEDGRRILSNVVHSQIDIHAEYGGVIPEIAARSHIEVVNPVIIRALGQAHVSWQDIDAIAVTSTPGLIGSLLVGNLAARTLAVLHGKPIYGVHHVEGHVYANFLVDQADTDYQLPSKQPQFPLLALAVSGKHSELILFRGHGDFTLLGETQDDAIGEAFDKVAKILGLPYPGGPQISRLAEQGDPARYQLPIAKMANDYDFSFSGLKTAVLRAVQREAGVDYRFPSYRLAERLTERQRADFAASFQSTAIQTLVNATKKAFNEFSPAAVVIAGGVAANQELRRSLQSALPISIEYAPINLCTDNAAMIAVLGYYYSLANDPDDPFAMEVQPSSTLAGRTWARAN